MKTSARLMLFFAFAALGVSVALVVGFWADPGAAGKPAKPTSRLAAWARTEEDPPAAPIVRAMPAAKPVAEAIRPGDGPGVRVAETPAIPLRAVARHESRSAAPLRRVVAVERPKPAASVASPARPAPLETSGIRLRPILAVPSGPIAADAGPIAPRPDDLDKAGSDGQLEYLAQRLTTVSATVPAAPTAPAAAPAVVPLPPVERVPLPPPALLPRASTGRAPYGLPLVRPAAPATSNVRPMVKVEGEGDGKLSIHIQNTDIREVLDLFCEQGNMNILAGRTVQGKVSATLNGVTIDSALDAILKSAGYVARREGKFIFVGTPDDFNNIEQALDRLGTRVYRPNYITAAELKTLVAPLLTEKIGVVSVSSPTEAGIAANDSTAGGNAYAGGDVVLVRDYEAVLAQIDQMVAEVDVRPLQVAIEAMILSVKLDDTNQFGVDFQLLRNKSHLRFGWGTPLDNLANFKFDDGGLKFGFLDGNLAAFLDAMESVGDTSVIASPRLMVLNKHRAEILIGDKKGYINQTVTETSSSQSVEFLEIGAQLRLRPFISSDGLIRMEVHPELSDGNVKLVGNYTLPEKTLTEVTTNIMVRDGCTVVIGGLMKEQLTNTVTGIPVLGAAPYIGWLFRHSNETTERHEVIVLITPHIVYEPGSCREGEKAACDFHRRHAVLEEKVSPIGRRTIARRYVRLAQAAQAAGEHDKAMRFAEMAVHFDPLSREAIDLRSTIWLGKSGGNHTLNAVGPPAHPVDGPVIADWVLNDLQRGVPPQTGPLHPMDPGQPGGHRDLVRPRKLE